jgi:hypothetical protein
VVQPESESVLEQLVELELGLGVGLAVELELELGVEVELVVEVELAAKQQVVESGEVLHWKPVAKGQLPFSLAEAGLVVEEAILALLRSILD